LLCDRKRKEKNKTLSGFVVKDADEKEEILRDRESHGGKK
jgi:hypothetical protein